MKELYLISGLGADKRVYDFLNLKDYKIMHINWIAPLPNEPIEAYAKKIAGQIEATKPILIGVSFGGMMAIELGKLLETEKIILISSAKIRADIPFYFRLIGYCKLHRLIPSALLKSVSNLTYWFFGVTQQSEKELLKSIIKETDITFLKWAIAAIVNWKNKIELQNVTTIHGTNDKLLPNKKGNFIVDGGGHFMIVNKADQISKIIQQELAI
jgi:pimeloyl-ACP methyl ester carboxylesterase